MTGLFGKLLLTQPDVPQRAAQLPAIGAVVQAQRELAHASPASLALKTAVLLPAETHVEAEVSQEPGVTGHHRAAEPHLV